MEVVKRVNRRSCGLTHQNQVTEFLHLHARLEGELEFTPFDDNVGEVEQMNLQRIWAIVEHAVYPQTNGNAYLACPCE